MFELLVRVEVLLLSTAQSAVDRSGPDRPRRLRGSAGQTTAEYALVMLGAAAIAALIVTWASKSDIVGKLFSFVLSKVIGAVQ